MVYTQAMRRLAETLISYLFAKKERGWELIDHGDDHYILSFTPKDELSPECWDAIVTYAYQWYQHWATHPPMSQSVLPILTGFTWQLNIRHQQVRVCPVYWNRVYGQISADVVTTNRYSSWTIDESRIERYEKNSMKKKDGSGKKRI